MKCEKCGKPIKNPYYINGKVYGYNCYKMEVALIYKQFEDEKNHEYSVKCFSAMQVFETKKSNSFHDSIMNQWNDCKKLTHNQLNCIINGFSFNETIAFYKLWFLLSNEENKENISLWTINLIQKNQLFSRFLDDEEIHNIILSNREYKSGFHFYYDIEEDNKIFICKNGKAIRNRNKEIIFDNYYLDEDMKDEYVKVVKVIKA